MSATTFYALNTLEVRGEKLRGTANIESLILRARVAERVFGLRLVPEVGERITHLIDELFSLLNRHQGDAEQDDSIAAANTYLTQFEPYAQAQRDVRSARLSMQQTAQELDKSFTVVPLDPLDAVNLLAEQEQPADSTRMLQLEQASMLRDKLANLRDRELFFTLEGSSQVRNDWEMRMVELHPYMKNLAVRLEGAEQESLTQASLPLGEYRAAIDRFAASRAQVSDSQTAMNVAADKVIELLRQWAPRNCRLRRR